MKRMTLGLATLLASVSAYSADIPLYPTGPEQDAAFLRFANATPGEFATVAALADAKGATRQLVVREVPDDFNGLKASLAFINADATCADAGLEAVAQKAELFKKVAEGAVQRRMINPVELSVQLKCAGAPVGQPLTFTLKAGERYSVLAVPSGTGSKLLFASDALAN